MKLEDYGVKLGDVFQLSENGKQFVVCDVITHSMFDININSPGRLQDPEVVFRSVENVNEWKPEHELIIIPLSVFKQKAIIIPLINRI
jgi:hypothetical protein